MTHDVTHGDLPHDGTAMARWWNRANAPTTPTIAWLGLIVLVFGGYMFAFILTGGLGLRPALTGALRNTISLVLVAAPAWALIKWVSARLRGPVALLTHAVFAATFALVWYWVLTLATGLSVARSLLDFDVRPFFPMPAATWQLLQGMTVYAALWALAMGRLSSSQASTLAALADESRPRPDPRFFIKRDGDAFPIDLDQVVAISGADDYSEVTTLTGTHLVRLTLAKFEAELDPVRFCRIHRSVIVNVLRIERFEPDGTGRLVVQMATGQRWRTSRAGATKLRERLI
ncbi:LytTR family DNA-binding domain-containing protein [Sphingomonas sp.]|uniref:LytTR family DNA-binding domain-containing protein n=1 Tax=Sphingomonas sp. TaxID=28214 RepID=UPI00286ABC40|nr:LytTR family DNA-binding domain-containing protein [Sphingomonas sp.]